MELTALILVVYAISSEFYVATSFRSHDITAATSHLTKGQLSESLVHKPCGYSCLLFFSCATVAHWLCIWFCLTLIPGKALFNQPQHLACCSQYLIWVILWTWASHVPMLYSLHGFPSCSEVLQHVVTSVIHSSDLPSTDCPPWIALFAISQTRKTNLKAVHLVFIP